jgi:hypothetical protein
MGVNVEDSVKEFYDTHGWKGGEDACSDNLDPRISHITPKPTLERWSVLRGEAGLV